jgi:hypothetical protein
MGRLKMGKEGIDRGQTSEVRGQTTKKLKIRGMRWGKRIKVVKFEG